MKYGTSLSDDSSLALLMMITALTLSNVSLAEESDHSAIEKVEKSVDRFGDRLPEGAKLRLGTIRLRGGGHAVNGVTFSPDSKSLVSCSWEDSIRFWDVKTGRLLRRFVTENDDIIFATAFSPDGGKLASVGLWDVQTGELISSVLGHVDRTFGVRVYGVAFAPDGLTFATAGADKAIRLWGAATGEELLELQTDEEGGDARPVAFSPDGSLLASGSEKGTILIWNLHEGGEARKIANAHQRDVTSLVFMKDGKRIISSGTHVVRLGNKSLQIVSEIHVWNVDRGELHSTFMADEELLGDCSLAITSDGKYLVSGHYEKIVIWDVETATPLRLIRGEKQHYGTRTHGLAISPDRQLVAAGVRTNKVYLWDFESGNPVLPQEDSHTEAVLAMDVSPDGSMIATGSADGTVRLWSGSTGEHLKKIDGGSGWVRYVQFFPDDKSLAIGRETYSQEQSRFEGEVKICNVKDGKVLHHFPVPDRVMCGALSSDGAILAVGISLGDTGIDPFGAQEGSAACKILVWNTESGAQLAELTGHKSQIQQVQFSADNKELWSTSEDQTVRKWNFEEGKEVENFDLNPENDRRRFSKLLLIPGTSYVVIPELERIDRHTSRGRISVKKLDSPEVDWEKQFPDTWPRHIAMSPNGNLIAAFLYPLSHPMSGSKAQNRIVVFSADNGQELQSFELEDGKVRSLAFSTNGRLLMSGMERSDALVWDISEIQGPSGPTN